MTMEEAVACLKGIKILGKDIFTRCRYDLDNAVDMAIKALEQEPCEDAVSRAEVIDELNRLGRNAFKEDTDYDNFFAFLDGLPLVTPTRKVGKWIYNNGSYKCPFCEHEITGREDDLNYCCKCGAEMRGGENE